MKNLKPAEKKHFLTQEHEQNQHIRLMLSIKNNKRKKTMKKMYIIYYFRDIGSKNFSENSNKWQKILSKRAVKMPVKGKNNFCYLNQI